jgi:prepilin-type N-terminal cleavage/methylation domain-containing protein
MKKGFTLIEVLIYLGIFSSVLIFLFLSAFNFLKYRDQDFYLNQLTKETIFLQKKIYFYLNGSNDFQITTSSTSTVLSIFKSTNYQISLQNGIFYLNSIPLSSSNFDFSSTTFEIISGTKKGIKINLQGKVKDKPKIKSLSIELIYFLK